MLKPKPTTSDITNKLLSKGREIVITNVCNLSCGGCCQMVGRFSKDQLWFISLEELDKSIQLLNKFPSKDSSKSPITIFGGEPTLHPKWDDIIQLLKGYSSNIFWINTNGRLGHKRYQKEDNLVWWVDLHPANQLFVQTSYAAKDAIKLSSDAAYWEKAQVDCPIWKGCQCSLYKGKAYFCENAAAIDWLYNNGKNGWDIDPNTNPFNKTKDEIDEQASHLCKRCGWCVTELVPRQLSKDPTYVSPSNEIKFTKPSKNIVSVKSPVIRQRWQKSDKLSALSNPPNVGLFKVGGKGKYDKIVKDNELSFVGLTVYESQSKEDALIDGRNNHDWTIILDKDCILPINAYLTLLTWMEQERQKDAPRQYISLPLYEISHSEFDANMLEPTTTPCDVIIAFHKTTIDLYNNDIFSKLGHRNANEGAGRASLWHDRLTDVVGGVVKLV